MKLPSTMFPVDSEPTIPMPVKFPEMTFTAANVVPPIVLFAELVISMPWSFPTASVPPASVPMKQSCTRLPPPPTSNSPSSCPSSSGVLPSVNPLITRFSTVLEPQVMTKPPAAPAAAPVISIIWSGKSAGGEPSMMTGWVIAGRPDDGAMIWSPSPMSKVMVSVAGVVSASTARIAWRRERTLLALSEIVLTTKLERSRRDSSSSKWGWTNKVRRRWRGCHRARFQSFSRWETVRRCDMGMAPRYWAQVEATEPSISAPNSQCVNRAANPWERC